MVIARASDCHAIGHRRQEHSYLALVMHAHHLVPTRTLKNGLRYRSVGLQTAIGTYQTNRSPRAD